jgi:hypothetical protein
MRETGLLLAAAGAALGLAGLIGLGAPWQVIAGIILISAGLALVVGSQA